MSCPQTTGAISNLDAPATSEEVRALVTVLWELASKLDRILSKFETPSNDPRLKNDLYKPRY